MKTQKVKIVVYRDKKREYRWQMIRSGRIVAESGEGYKRAASCLKTLSNLLRNIELMNYEYQLPPKN